MIVPLTKDGIAERYRSWLRHVDPDFVLLVTYDNEALVTQIMELLPGAAIEERQRKRGEPAEHPVVGLDSRGLSALSWLPLLKIATGGIQTPPQFILDSYPAWTDDGFVGDNFGTPLGSVNPYPAHEQLGVRAMMLTPADAPKDRWRYQLRDPAEVLDGYKAAELMSSMRGIVTMAYLSNMVFPTHLPAHPWSDKFCLVVGDAFEDRISCWNAGLLYDGAQSQAYNVLRVPSAVVLNEEKSAQLAAFLGKRNGLGRSNGTPSIALRSHSIDEKAVETLIACLRDRARSRVEFVPIASIEDCCSADIKQADRVLGNLFRSPAEVSRETTIRDDTTPIAAPALSHLDYCAGQHPIFTEGMWYVDVSIDRINDNSQYSNVRESWVLPMRPQLIPLFCRVDGARLLRSGELSVPVSAESHVIEIGQPEDADIFRCILSERPPYPHSDMRSRHAAKIVYSYSASSDKGRYLRGVLGMFGSLHDFAQTIGNHFWRTQFFNMAVPAQGQQEEVIRDLKLRLRATGGRLVLEDPTDWQKLAERVVQKTGRLRMPRQKTSYDRLFQAWQQELTTASDRFNKLTKSGIELEPDLDELKEPLGWMLERGVFYRGHEWVCRKCSHRNWLAVESLKETLSCVVCREDYSLPVDVALDFRLNEFLATCLREHDTVSVAWALNALRSKARRSFVFETQTDLYHNYPEDQEWKADRELDVFCIVDGRVVVGEVKARVNLIGTSDIKDLATVAVELNADIAVIAAVEGEANLLWRKTEELRSLLPPKIEVQSLLSDWTDAPTLDLGKSARVRS